MRSITLKSCKTVKLGRICPAKSFDAGNFRVNMFADGSSVLIPKLSAHYNKTLDRDPPPASVDYSPKAMASLSRMYLNDTYGDCVIASKGHSVGIWSGNEEGSCILATDAEILQNYTSICGPGDQGCVITDVLDAMRASKFIMNGKPATIDSYVAIDWTNQNLVQVALDVFGSLCIGINLTDDCTNSGPGVVWNFSGSIVGGHDIAIYAYDSKGVYISTWGTIGTLIPWSVFLVNAGQNAGVEECYAMLSPNWYDQGNLAPNGINATTLAADLTLVGSGTVPPIGPAPTPTPPSPTPTPVPPTPTPTPVPPGQVTITSPKGDTFTLPNGWAVSIPQGSSPGYVQSDLKAAGLNSTLIQDIVTLLMDLLSMAKHI